MLHKNLTPFFWGPKVTSRYPPQIEMAVCVRGVFRLEPGLPLEAIEEPMEQGFMCGDMFDPEDVEMKGALRHTSDFADWKPNLDLLLKGTAYPPGGADIACDVKFGVGEWSKTLRVIGPRTYRPGVLFGGRATTPEPFTNMPLTWENTFGGPKFALNPVGRGHSDPELPTVVYPSRPVIKQGERGVAPAGFGPISPQWPQRIGKRGKNYGLSYRRTRAPFFSDDFDWSYFNAAPADQQLTEFLRGDEELVFENLHPTEPVFKCRLPGLRVRAFVRGEDDEVREPAMVLDTLEADLDAGRLYLTWRGLTPINAIDMTDVQSALIVSEPIDTQTKPQQFYIDQLEAFEADPVGLNAKFPPGFLEVGQAIEAFELAEMKGEECPVDLMALSKTLPAGCPFPPWFLTATAGAPDPLGMADKFPPGTLEAAARGDEDPLGIMKNFPPGFPTETEANELVANLKDAAAKHDPEGVLDAMAELERAIPEDARPDFHRKLAETREALRNAKSPEEHAPGALAAALAAPPAPPPLPPVEKAGKDLQKAEESLSAREEPAAAEGAAALAAVPSIDQMVATLLMPLAAIVMPEVPQIPDGSEEFATAREKLAADEAKLRERGVDHPLLGLFKVGSRLIDKVSAAVVVEPPDIGPVISGLGKVKGHLLAAGVSLGALGALTGLIEKVEAVQAKLPPKPPAPERTDFAYQKLREHDFSGQDLSGRNFARAVLSKANFAGANLSGADLTEANLVCADLSGANLSGAILKKVEAPRANFSGADLSGADLTDAVLESAQFVESNLCNANLLRATLDETNLSGAKLRGASLIEANLDKTNLSGADLTDANLESAKGERMNFEAAVLERANLQFAVLDKGILVRANLRGANLSLAKLSKVRGDGVDLSDTTLEMTKITESLLRGAVLRGAKSNLASFSGSDLSQADLRGCQFSATNLSETTLDEANFDEALLDRVDLRDAQANKARFVKTKMPKCAAGGKAKFTDCQFVCVDAPGSLWQDTELSRCDFSHANMKDCHFQGAYGEDVSFFAAHLKGAAFTRAKLARVRFLSADLCHADLSHTTFLDAQFTRANCYNTKFIGATLGGCDFLEANLDAAVFDEDYRPLGRP